MHKTPMLRALRKVQEDKGRFSNLAPALQKAIRGALSEFETIFSVCAEKKLPKDSVTEDLSGFLALLFVIETLGEPQNLSQWLSAIQGQVDRAKVSLKAALNSNKPRVEPGKKIISRDEMLFPER